MINRMHWAALTLASVLLAAPAVLRAEVVVIVSAKNPSGPLSAEQVSNIFLGKANAFPGGGTAVPIDQAESSPVRKEFYTKAAGKDDAQMKAYWSRIVFTGKGTPPKEAGGSAEVKNLVASNPNLIGYIEKSAVDASVKVLFSAP